MSETSEKCSSQSKSRAKSGFKRTLSGPKHNLQTHIHKKGKKTDLKDAKILFILGLTPE